MRAPDYEVVVIGGGIHGVGVAQAAAAAGWSVLLCDSHGLAFGTSSRSSKLIHGGLRYLESGQWSLVRESLRERKILLRTAPELVRLVPFHLPIYADTTRRPWQLRAGLSLYALLGNLRPTTRFRSLPEEEWSRLDGLRQDGLQAVFRYQDGQTDDAELTRAVMTSATELGAELWQPARLDRARKVDRGYEVYIERGRQVETLACSALINASGPWVEEVRKAVEPRPPGMEIDLVAGAHVELEGALEHGVYYAEAQADRRAVFAIPWKGRTLVGTTETPYEGDPAAVAPTDEELEYLTATFAHYFPEREPQLLDSWAGLRVLPRESGSYFGRSRETALIADDRARPRFVGIYGGKLTTWRATASKVVRLLQGSLPSRPHKARTQELKLRTS